MPAYGALNSSFTVNGVVHDPVTGLETGSGHDRFNQYVTWDGSDQLQLETGSGHDRLTFRSLLQQFPPNRGLLVCDDTAVRQNSRLSSAPLVGAP